MAGLLARRHGRTNAVVVAAAVLGLAIPPMSAARATYPGAANGRISFTQEAQNCWNVRSVTPSATAGASYTNCAGGAGATAWSPNGKRLAAALRLGNDSVTHLDTIDASSGSHVQVAGVTKAADDPYWSPDGSTLVYVSDVTGFGAYQNVYTVPAAGGQPTDLTNYQLGTGRVVADPEFAPDGQHIVFEQSPAPAGSPSQIWTMTANGQSPTQLATTLSGSSMSPSWSPDGTKIAFANNSSGNFDIYVMNADGSNPTVVPGASSRDEISPVWSPDGTRLAYTVGCKDPGCFDSQNNQMDNGDIYVMNADGSSRHALVATTNPEFAPDWGTSTVACTGCGSSGGGTGGSTGHRRTVSFRFHALTIAGRVVVPDGTNVCRVNVPVTIQRVQTLQGGAQDKDWRRGAVKTVRTTQRGRFHLHIHLAGDYRALAPAATRSGSSCRRAVSAVHENDLIHDVRGDSRGPIDIKSASLRYSHHKIIGKIVAFQPFSSSNNPCFLVNGTGPNRPGAAVGCFRQVLCCTNGNGGGPPVSVSHPNATTIVFTSSVGEWKKLGFSKKQRWLYWVGWARQSDSNLWDDAPNGCFAPGVNDKGCGTRNPVLTLPASAF